MSNTDDNTNSSASRESRRSTVGLIAGIVAFAVLLSLPAPEGLGEPAWRVAAVGVLLAIFWITEALPVAATALLPLALFPFLGIAPVDDASAPYGDKIIFLFLGGFLIALGIERWGLHRRIALNVLLRVGAKEHFQIGGFMIATAALSMWVSNTATTVMMLPVALSIVPRDPDGNVAPEKRGFASALLLAVAYAANIGGVATLIGTPPNAYLASYMLETYGVDIGFAQWMLIGLPVTLTMLAICWVLLTRFVHKVGRTELAGARETIAQSLSEMGAPSRMEKRVAGVFVLVALAWITRPLITKILPGALVSDTSIAIAGALLLFVMPSGRHRGERLLDWHQARKLPWGVLLLFGGGLSLAKQVTDTGLAEWIAGSLSGLGSLPVVVLVLAVTLLIIFLTELTSNIATTVSFLPLVAALADSLGQEPLLLAIPAVIAASFAFMLPVATPPNAIVFSSGHIRIPQMARAGIWLNLVGTAVIITFVYLLQRAVFGV